MLESPGKMRQDLKLEHMGNFVYNPSLIIGGGEEGTIYLAQHIPTGQYVAVKRSYSKYEYKAFKNIKRLYACYKSDDVHRPLYSIFTPLVMTLSIDDYIISDRLFLKKKLGLEVQEKPIKSRTRDDVNPETGYVLSYDNFRNNLALMKAVIAEEEYLIRRGAEYQPHTGDDKFIFDDGDGKPEVVFVDLKSAKKNIPNAEAHLLLMFRDLLGLKYFLGPDGTLRENVEVPLPIKIFVKEYCENRHSFGYTLEMLKDLLRRLSEGIAEWESKSLMQEK